MLRNSASKILSISRREWQLSFPLSYSKQSNGSPGSLWSNAHQTIVINSHNQERQSSHDGIPRISLTPPRSLLSLSRRYSSTSTTDETTFRERMESRRDRGRAAASKGAHSLRGMVQKYGTVFLGTYFTVYFSTLGLLFTGIESGALDPAYVMSWVSEDADAKTTVQVVTEFMGHYSLTRPYVPVIESNPEVANLGVAWIAVKFTEPIRFGITVAIVPRLARYLGYAPALETPESEDAIVTEITDEPLETSTKPSSNEEVKSPKS